MYRRYKIQRVYRGYKSLGGECVGDGILNPDPGTVPSAYRTVSLCIYAAVVVNYDNCGSVKRTAIFLKMSLLIPLVAC